MDGSLRISNMSRWVVIYPIYINSKKTLAEGRRIGVVKACENPNVVEIGDCCQYLKLPCAIEVCLLFFCTVCNFLKNFLMIFIEKEKESVTCILIVLFVHKDLDIRGFLTF